MLFSFEILYNKYILINMKHIQYVFNSLIILSVFFTVSCEKENNGINIKYSIEIPAKEELKLLSVNNESSEFKIILEKTDSLFLKSSDNYINLFGKTWHESCSDNDLRDLFLLYGNYNLNQIINFLNSEYKKHVKQTILILIKRLNEYEITDIHISNFTKKGILELEIRGINNADEIRNLINNQYQIGFYETYEYSELFNSLLEADKIIAESDEFNELFENNEKDTTSLSLFDTNSSSNNLNAEEVLDIKNYPLSSKLVPNIQQNNNETIIIKGPVVGYCLEKDTAEVMKMLKYIQNLKYSPLPRKLEFIWTAKPVSENDKMFKLIALKLKFDNLPVMNGKNIVNANSKQQNGINEIELELNAEGAQIFKNLTKENIGKSIAIVINGFVYSYPVVYDVIEDGKCTISSNFEDEESEEMKIIFKSGYMPLKIKILNETPM